MAEQRLIDANKLNRKKKYQFETHGLPFPKSDWFIRASDLFSAETIDQETLPIVKQLRAEVAGLKDQLDRLEYWQLDRKIVLESAAQDRAAVNVMRKHCEKTIAELRAELKQVKADRDAAVKDLETAMGIDVNDDVALITFLCSICAKENHCVEDRCKPKWRGPKKEDANE